MLKVLIVDDEYLVRKGLQTLIDWESLGFEVVGEATNGNEGYEKYHSLHPDVIITDIRMKIATGIEMIERLREDADFDAEIVILTAFDKFDYAKAALENGVAGYILKPVVEEEIENLMRKIEEKILKKKSEATYLSSVNEHFRELRNIFLKELLLGRITDPEIIDEKSRLYQIDFPKGKFTIADVCVEGVEEENADELHRIILDTVNYCDNPLENQKSILCEIDKCHIAIIICYHDDGFLMLQPSFLLLADYFTNLGKQFEASTGKAITIGFSLEHAKVSDISNAFSEANKAQRYKKYIGTGTVIDYRDIPQEDVEFITLSNKDLEKIITMLKNNDANAAKCIYEPFFKKVKAAEWIDIEALKTVVMEISIIIIRYFVPSADAINKIFGKNVVPYNEINKLHTIEELEQWFYNLMDDLFKYAAEIKNDNKKGINEIIKAKEIIERDYADEISSKTVANQLYISSYYLMHLFKEKTGKTFNEYLTQVRIEKAKELILTSHYKIYEISAMVGYKDNTYFNNVFKRLTGVTPKKYAQLRGNGQ